jgi:hypothetical protein
LSTIPDIAFALVLGLAALLAIMVGARARPAARDYLAFAAALYGALAIADLAAAIHGSARPFATAVTLAIAALAPSALVLALAAAFERPPRAWWSLPVLVLSAAAGIYAAATDAVFVVFAPLFACLCVMLALAARRARYAKADALHAVLSAFCLLAAASAFMTGGLNAFALFSSAGLMGAALASRRVVEHARARRLRPRPAIRSVRGHRTFLE